MNLKKAFRYQNFYSKMITDALTNIRLEHFTHNYAVLKKSELNRVALNKDYQDEIKEIGSEYDLTSYGSSAVNFSQSQICDYKILADFIRYLFIKKAELTDAISRAKSKVKIQPNGFETPITYDSAISLASTYRKYISLNETHMNRVRESIREKICAEKVIVSLEQPPVDAYYTRQDITEAKSDNVAALNTNNTLAKVFVEDLSDKIEAASLQAEVKFTPEIPVTATFNDYFEKYDQFIRMSPKKEA